MRHISENNKFKEIHNNVNNVNKKISNNVNNDKSSNGKYALDRNKFTPNTEKTQLAEQIASYFNDLDNYAGFLKVVNELGVGEASRLFKVVKSDIDEKANTKTPVRYPAKYFIWKFRKGFY
ncbi:MAG: hypothetical protein UU21_C0006G0007 [Candidatus Levybacteria bacterium GW2011_GWA2_40_8]|nr:MAG: hypothetical protein UU21_C0006G0007 [Candidatus Levybacteria bacterium GW2011_GWA2_40_8]